MKYEGKLETLAATETDHRVRRPADRPVGVLIVTPVRQGDLRKIRQHLPCSCEAGRRIAEMAEITRRHKVSEDRKSEGTSPEG